MRRRGRPLLVGIGSAIRDASLAMVSTETPGDAVAIYFVLFTLFPSVLMAVGLVDEIP